MTAPELKTCPFCGGKAELWRAHPHPDRAAWISCMGKCSVLVSKEHKTDAEAIAAWNTRADIPAARIAELEGEVARLRAIENAAKHVRSLDEDEFEVIVGNCAYHNLRAALAKDRAP